MIDAAITLVAGQLNQALKRQFTWTEDLVAVCNLREADGAAVTQAANKVAAFLVNIEREALFGSGVGMNLDRSGLQAPPLHLNLLLMFTANFGGSNYAEALKFLSSTVAFFQSKPVFTHSNAPDLDSRIEKLTLEIETLSFSDLSNLWGIIGGNYLPSVLYRMRLLSFDAGQINAQIPRVSQPEAGVRG
ncbi:MAG: DUF4255 domain-containing protein [Leptothrix sp. (in: b-proteobacteria)]